MLWSLCYEYFTANLIIMVVASAESQTGEVERSKNMIRSTMDDLTALLSTPLVPSMVLGMIEQVGGSWKSIRGSKHGCTLLTLRPRP